MNDLHTTYLGLGSNLGNRLNNLRLAIDELAQIGEIRAVSNVYETEPWGVEGEQPLFLNLAVEFATQLKPQDLVAHLKQIESKLGRQPSTTNQPRVIDIDILLYENLLIKTPKLTIPHPEMQGRAFVLAPLADIALDLVVAGTNQTVATLFENTDKAGIKLHTSAIGWR